MFEQELEMEKSKSSIVPLILIVALIIAIVGVTLYFVAESRKVLTPAEATPIIQQSIESQLPVTMHFRTGGLSISSYDDPHNPNYRLLEKAGYIKIGKPKKDQMPVSLTAEGKTFLDSVTGVQKVKKGGDMDEYTVPLAHRKLLRVGQITMEPPSKAVVEYTWTWETTKAGDLFDAAGDLVKSFGTYERTMLIDKYGANFYHQGPTTIAVLLVKQDGTWEISKGH